MRTFILLLLLAVSAAAASAPTVRLRGFLQSDLAGLYGIDDTDLSGTGSSMLSLNMQTRNSRRARVEAELDVTQYYGAAAEQASASFDSSLALLLDTATPVTANLRMLYAALFMKYADVYVGRQIINFGKGFVFSPVDAYSTVDLADLAFRRNGSSAARARIPLGVLSGIDLVTSLGSGGDAPAAVKVYTNITGWDLEMTGIYKQKTYETYAGLSFKGDLVLGVYGELVQRFVKNADTHDVKAMLGLDYSVGRDWLFMAEYYYREVEQATAAEPLYGRHNLFGNVQYTVNELMNVSVNTLANVDEGITLTTLQFYRSLFQNTDTVLYVRHYGLGTGPLASLMPYDVEAGTRITVKF